MLAACHLVRLLVLAHLEIPLHQRGQLALLPLLLLLFGILLLPPLAILPRGLDEAMGRGRRAGLRIIPGRSGGRIGIGLGGSGLVFLGGDTGLGGGGLTLACGRHQLSTTVVSLRRFSLRLQLIGDKGRQTDVDVHLTP
ncbi:hypothetical protein D3C80_1683850 [compost metagenome]